MKKISITLSVMFLSFLLFLIIMNDAPMDKMNRISIFIHYLNTTLWTIILSSSIQFYFKYSRRLQLGSASFIYFILSLVGATLLLNETYMLTSTLYAGNKIILSGDGFFNQTGPWIASKLSITVSGLGIIYLYMQGQIDKIAFQSSTDELTNLPNRRYLEDIFNRELSRSKRHGLPMSCAMIDIDFFKKFNDTYGHQTGDYVLRQVAQILDNGKRAHDIVARYGGEEFIWLLINSDPESSYTACERLRKEVDETDFEFNEKSLSITISIGLSSYSDDDDETVNSLIYNADRAMYEAKKAGRNKSVSFEESPSSDTNK